MTDISPDQVERLAKTADIFAKAMKAWQHKTQKHNEDVRDTLRALSARVQERDAVIADLVGALEDIARPKIGPDFDWSDEERTQWQATRYRRTENAARAALSRAEKAMGEKADV